MSSEQKCGNCDESYNADENGPVIQTCPNCGSQEMVKGFGVKQERGKK